MIDNLKAFAAVIDCKSLTKAASRLFLTQSAVNASFGIAIGAVA